MNFSSALCFCFTSRFFFHFFFFCQFCNAVSYTPTSERPFSLGRIDFPAKSISYCRMFFVNTLSYCCCLCEKHSRSFMDAIVYQILFYLPCTLQTWLLAVSGVVKRMKWGTKRFKESLCWQPRTAWNNKRFVLQSFWLFIDFLYNYFFLFLTNLSFFFFLPNLLFFPFYITSVYFFDSTQSSNCLRGARGVMVIVVGNGHGDTCSNTGRDWLQFT